MLFKPCTVFKESVRINFPGAPYLPKVVKLTDTIETLIRVFVESKVHRIFVCDPVSGRPFDIITQSVSCMHMYMYLHKKM